ncbi:VOC family protein [Brevibacterium sp.]|uniref:VOC family protein n=1 Tax=Brevibacterium sp. TaxID=1701 RepID=UPI0028119ED0|nr:VOC family protein [Brevibacterium sp.]
MAINAYVFYSNGQCAEAFDMYQGIFGGEVSIMRMKDAPEDHRMPGAPDDSVMHAVLKFGDTLLMGSDDPTGDGGPKTGVALSYTAPDTQTARSVFGALSDGGEVQMPLEKTFWAEAFGACVDRFGVSWMVDTEEQPS